MTLGRRELDLLGLVHPDKRKRHLTGSDAIIYVVSASKFVVVSASDPNPAVLEFEH